MSYSKFGISICPAIFCISIFSPLLANSADSNTEFDKAVVDVTTQSINSEVTEDELSDDEEDEFCPDELAEQDEDDEISDSLLDGAQKSISSGIEYLVRSIDGFFTKDGENYDSTGSQLKLRQNVLYREGGIVEFTNDVSFIFHLPNTEKKLQLFFETTSNKDPLNLATSADNTPTSTVNEGEYVLGVQADSGKKFGWKYKPIVAINLGSLKSSYIKFRFNSEYEFSKWHINWHETPYWHNLNGGGVDSYFELSRKINGDDMFRSSTFAGWKNETKQVDLSQVFSMYHIFGKKKALSYYAGAYGISEPAPHATHYLIGATYRQNIYKDYLFIELAPQIQYLESNNYSPAYSIVFRLDMLFNK